MSEAPERIWAWPDDVEDGFMAASRVNEPPKPEYGFGSHHVYVHADKFKYLQAENERLRGTLETIRRIGLMSKSESFEYQVYEDKQTDHTEVPSVRPLDFSYALKHAFLSGFVAAKNLPAHEPYNGVAEWAKYDASENLATRRILGYLSKAPDRLEHLQAENERLREAVRVVRREMNTKVNGGVGWMAEFEALTALAKEIGE